MSSRTPGNHHADRILVVEDDAAQRIGLQQLLRSWGFDADVASDGQEALTRVSCADTTRQPSSVLTYESM